MFTCNTCNLQFPTAEDQRSHMKSEWHRYNLKRRVAQLPPIDEELFNSKVASLTKLEEEPAKEKQLTKKEQRRKEKEAILQQKKQILEQAKKAMLAKLKETGELPVKQDPEAQDGASQEEETKPEDEQGLTEEQQEEKMLSDKLANKTEIPPTTCLFAHPKYHHEFSTIDENIDHMFKAHGLYIPETNYLVDKQGLLEYLGEKIGFGFCIACNYQGRTAEAAREHMQQKRHMRIPYETEDEKLEISKFYDFSSTYDDGKVVVDGNAEEDDGEWEDVSGDEEDEEDGEALPPAENDAIYQHGTELHLPSGAIVGHRSMARYYRQNLAPERELTEGQGTVIAAETRHMLTLQDRKELASKKRTWKREKKSEDLNDRRAAKFINNQPHFRDQLLQ
ncbi:Cytoplasmic 60S subunit biogenesis factor REI1 [Candida viswanathii]|uniref:Cytoplasmic 60S subunit biogenesis factor REI1 n=1 Tax=Candida viswanathii TaxID=5486 RepID=A0A367XQP7_9ASCO|nr:Cytoplasmic 60S subunit biogenesis factor REI1 [Candida viswanathii]